jgi:DNA-binding MarR family transcriptional regulator
MSASEPVAVPIDSPDRRRLPPLLRRAWYGLNQAFRRKISHTGVTPDQFTVMRCLVEAGDEGVTQSALSATMTSDPNTIASLLERMETSLLVSRRPHARDRRAHRIELTALGRSKYDEVRQLAIGLQREVLGVLPEADRERFLEQLDCVADACRAEALKVGRKPKKKERQPDPGQ